MTPGNIRYRKNRKLLLIKILVIVLCLCSSAGLFVYAGAIMAGGAGVSSMKLHTPPAGTATPKITPSPSVTPTLPPSPTPSPSPSPSPAPSPSPSPVLTPSPSPRPTPVPVPTPTFNRPPNATSEQRVVYLTFDDGPGKYTDAILNTLAEKNVKATFFTVGNRMSTYADTVKRIVAEGHALGCHSYSHMLNKNDKAYAYIYGSPAALKNEITLWEKEEEKIIGQPLPYKIFRFPGGSSSNNVKSNYNAYMVMLQEQGYRVYDWNAVTDDSKVSDPTVSYIHEHFNSSMAYYERACGKYPCILLMHDIKQATAESLGWIIDELTQRGYTFATLDGLEQEYLH